MPNASVRPADLKLTRLVAIFAVLAILLLGLLSIAPLRGYFSEWRAAREAYNALAAPAGLRVVGLGIDQIWKPELGVVDRCTTCHLGMGKGEPIPDVPLYAAHPPIPHDPAELGCTVCHAGQGRATTAADAHGAVPHWEEPLLEPLHLEAGCGTCHSHIPIAPEKTVAAGGDIFKDAGCDACHRIGGEGSDSGPDLSYAGLMDIATDWHAAHNAKMLAADEGPWADDFTPLADEEITAVDAYLKSLVGAPRLMAGKMLAHRLGCRGCHRIGDVGGDDGPDLSDIGRRLAADLDFDGVTGPHTLANWLSEHFLAPARVAPDSLMPALVTTREEADLLTTYMLSLRMRPIPERLAPRDRVRGMRLGEREFATDGASLYGVFCAACHGEAGAGRYDEVRDFYFPAIGNPDFLALAGKEILRDTLIAGRLERRMPAWGTKAGGLRSAEVDAMVAYLRSLEPAETSFDDVTAEEPDLEHGKRVYALECATCHGAAGEGTVVGPPLAAEDNPANKEDSRIYGTLTFGISGTAMGSFRRLDARDLRAVIAAVREMPDSGSVRVGWETTPGDAVRGEPLFAKHCASCHGARGEGKSGPALADPGFLSVVHDGFIAGTIIRGRVGTKMPAFRESGEEHEALDAAAVADIIAFLRTLEATPNAPAPESPGP